MIKFMVDYTTQNMGLDMISKSKKGIVKIKIPQQHKNILFENKHKDLIKASLIKQQGLYFSNI